jgi:hypothetical protein
VIEPRNLRTVGAFILAVIGGSTKYVEKYMKWRDVQSPTGVREQGRSIGWVDQEPVRSHEWPHKESHGTARWTEPWITSKIQGVKKEEKVWGLKAKTISRQVKAMGSRSAFIVPMMVGNSTHEDPVEGREASRM